MTSFFRWGFYCTVVLFSILRNQIPWKITSFSMKLRQIQGISSQGQVSDLKSKLGVEISFSLCSNNKPSTLTRVHKRHIASF